MSSKQKVNTKQKEKINTVKPTRVTRSASTSSESQISLPKAFKMAAKVNEAGGGSEEKIEETNKSQDTQEKQFQIIIKKLESMEKTNKEQLEAINDTFDRKLSDIKTEFMKVYTEVKKEVDKTREEITELNTKVVDIEKGVTFNGDRIDDIEKELDTRIEEKITEMESKHAAEEQALKKQIKVLEEKMLLTEKHNRKCNLLFYGIPEPPKDKTTGKPVENTQATLKDFFRSDLKLSESFIEQVQFGNVHRLNPRTKGDTPIIARFLSYPDRETVFRAAHKLGPGKRILSDLPVVLKEERHRLADVAYKLRHKSGDDKRQTRIIEDGAEIVLQVRKTHLDKWEKLVV